MKIRTEQYTPAYRRVIIDNPPINIFDREMADEFQTLLTELDSDEKVRVVVFESANPNYFIAPADSIGAAGFDAEHALSGPPSFHYFLRRMERANYVTVGVLRGHASGAGSEFLLGLDVRFASRESAVFSQIDPGTEFSNVRGGFERLCSLVGRARALEIILDSEDLDADTAERLSLINRAVPDEDIDRFIERFVSHVSNFNRENIAFIKRTAGEQFELTPIIDINETTGQVFDTLKWSEIQERVATPVERFWHQKGDSDIPLGEQFRPDYDY